MLNKNKQQCESETNRVYHVSFPHSTHLFINTSNWQSYWSGSHLL